jgi:predicted XRE-type DNA-binding protein
VTKRKVQAEGRADDRGQDVADEHSLKSAILVELSKLIEAQGLTQVKAAQLVGISQPDLSRLLRDDFANYSTGRLMKMLTAFGQDVEITTRPRRRAGERGRITFRPGTNIQN